MKAFKTHTGQIVKGKALKKALNAVADDLVKLAYDIRKEDAYTSHVTNEEKTIILRDGLTYAEQVRKGEITDLTFYQRLNTKLTGECIGLLP